MFEVKVLILDKNIWKEKTFLTINIEFLKKNFIKKYSEYKIISIKYLSR